LWSLLFRHYDDELITHLSEAGTTGMLEGAEGLRAYFGAETERGGLANLGGEFRVEEPDIPWKAPEDWEPVIAGERFLIVPPGYSGKLPEGRFALPLQLGAAFGTGRHETTQLALEAMEQFVRRDQAVLDAGCGTGILTAAAQLLGARRVFSCDTDVNAVQLARQHASEAVFAGSADAVASSSMDLVVANLTASILETLAWDLRRVTRPDGMLLVSGFLRDATPGSFRPQQEFERDGWLCWVCRPEDVSTTQPPSGGLTHKAEWWL